MMETRRLDDAVAALVRPEVKWFEQEMDDGTVEKHMRSRPSLLDQLRRAHLPGMEARQSEGGKSMGSPSPLALNAADLYQEIDDAASWHYWRVKTPAHRLRSYVLETRIEYWAAEARLHEQLLNEAIRVTEGWVRAIEELFDPPRTTPLAGTCPECHAVSQIVEQDGEHYRKTALTLNSSDAGPFARCTICGKQWPSMQLVELAELMSASHRPSERMDS